jgi:Dissimilatory sulfite reductase D (DsrD).
VSDIKQEAASRAQNPKGLDYQIPVDCPEDLLGVLELSYNEKETHWKHGGIVGVFGYGGGVIGRYCDQPEAFPGVAHFHTMADDKDVVVEFLKSKSASKSKFYFKDFLELFPDKGPRDVKKVLTKLVNEEVLEFWSSGSTTMPSTGPGCQKALPQLDKVFLGRFHNLSEQLIKCRQVYPVDKAVERFNGYGDIPCGIFFAKKKSGHAVDPRITPGICCRKNGNIWQATKVNEALRIPAHGTKCWILVGSGPRGADITAEYGKFAVKFCKTIAVNAFTVRNVSKSSINALKFDRPQIDYALPKGINPIGGQQRGKIKAIRKPGVVLLLEAI